MELVLSNTAGFCRPDAGHKYDDILFIWKINAGASAFELHDSASLNETLMSVYPVEVAL